VHSIDLMNHPSDMKIGLCWYQKGQQQDMVCQNSQHAYLFEEGMTQIPATNEILSIVCHVEIHFDVLWTLVGLHLPVWSELRQSRPFRPMRDLRMQRSQGLQSRVCRKWPGPSSVNGNLYGGLQR
jgi:hypothetical protein